MIKLCSWKSSCLRVKPTTLSATFPKPGLPSPQPGPPPMPFTVPQSSRQLLICSQASLTSLFSEIQVRLRLKGCLLICDFFALSLQVSSMQLRKKIVKLPILTSSRLLRATIPLTAPRQSLHWNTCFSARSCSACKWDNRLHFIPVCVWEDNRTVIVLVTPSSVM